MTTTPCPHVDVDVNGTCYACGTYVEAGDVGIAIAALFPDVYEAATGRPAWLDADPDHPATRALRPLADLQDHDDEEQTP